MEKETRICPDDGNAMILQDDNGSGFVKISDIFGGHVANIPKLEWLMWKRAEKEKNG